MFKSPRRLICDATAGVSHLRAEHTALAADCSASRLHSQVQLLGQKQALNQLGGDRQRSDVDVTKVVEATPRTRQRKSCVPHK